MGRCSQAPRQEVSRAEGYTKVLCLTVPALPAALDRGGGTHAPASVSACSDLQPGLGPSAQIGADWPPPETPPGSGCWTERLCCLGCPPPEAALLRLQEADAQRQAGTAGGRGGEPGEVESEEQQPKQPRGQPPPPPAPAAFCPLVVDGWGASPEPGARPRQDMAAGEPVACGSPDWNLPVSGLSCRDHGRALARSQLACPSSSAMPCLTCHVPTGQAEHTHTRTPLAGAEGGALRPRPLGLRRREGLPSPGVSCVLSQSAQGGRGRGSRRCRSGAASGCRVPWPQHPDLCPQACPRLCRMRPQGSSASPALWVLGCLTLLLWLWVLCTACHRYVGPGLGGAWLSSAARRGGTPGWPSTPPCGPRAGGCCRL